MATAESFERLGRGSAEVPTATAQPQHRAQQLLAAMELSATFCHHHKTFTIDLAISEQGDTVEVRLISAA